MIDQEYPSGPDVQADFVNSLLDENEELRAELVTLRAEVVLWEAMKEGVSIRIADLDAENTRLRAVTEAARQFVVAEEFVRDDEGYSIAWATDSQWNTATVARLTLRLAVAKMEKSP